MELTRLATEIVGTGEYTTTDLLLDYGDKIAAAKQVLREVEAEWERRMIERIDRDGPIKCGEILYRVGNPPKTTCLNLPGAVQAVLESVGGDFDVFCQHLSANALKHGACQKTLPPERYAELFHVEREKELTKDEATPRRLAKLNLAYCR